METTFTPISSLLGGLMIGGATGLLLLANGKIAGISGIIKGVLKPAKGDWLWRFLFLVGMLTGGAIFVQVKPDVTAASFNISTGIAALAGMLVGLGTGIGSGCTSGHGICGISRLSKRSITATIVFMASGFVTMYLMRHIWGLV